jgi:hypothetical protein
LGTILTIFRASARLDAEQSADLNFTRIEVQTMYLMSTKQQFIKRQFKKVQHFGLRPVMANFSFGGTHVVQAPALMMPPVGPAGA